MSSPMVEPITAMLARWWAATQAGDTTGAALIVGLWRAEVIAAAQDEDAAGQPTGLHVGVRGGPW